MKLRLWHHRDGARVAYREAGMGPALVLLHSATLSHREFEPLVEHLTHRFRLVLVDLPLHGDSEDRPNHPYSPEWFAQVMGAFCHDVGGRSPNVGGHGLGAEILLSATISGDLRPGRLVLMPNGLHRPPEKAAERAVWRTAARGGAVPGLNRALSHGAHLVFRPSRGTSLSVRGDPAAADLLRHAFADVGGNTNLARSWARHVAAWPAGTRRELLDAYPTISVPTLLLWADQDRLHPLQGAREALDLLPDGLLRVLDDTGYLIAYDDPVGVARELSAFCR